MPETELEAAVAVVGAPWAESSFYDDAEGFTHIFWDENTLFRRLFDLLDLSSVVELSCGHGRHSERVAQMTKRLTLVDIFDANLEFCRRRLARFPFVNYIQNNGYSFQPIASDGATAIFCYDSMVHFSPSIVESYLNDAARILKPGGMALFHHSNYASPLDRHYGQNPHARNHMTQLLFQKYAVAAGLSIRESVVMGWGGVESIDCVTLVRRPD